MRFLNNSGDEMHPDVATRIHASMRLVYPGLHPPKKKKKKKKLTFQRGLINQNSTPITLALIGT